MSKVPSEAILMPPEEKAPIHTGNIFSWMWYFLTPYRQTVVWFTLYRFIRYTFLGLMPLAIGYVIDGFESGDVYDNVGYYTWVLVGYMVLHLIILTPNFLFTHEVAVFEKASRAMTLYSIRHLNSLPLEWHERNESGKKLQRVMTGRRGFQELTRHIRWDIFPLIGQMCAIAVSFAIVDMPPFYMVLYALFAGTYILVSWYFLKPYLALYDRFNQMFERLLGGVYEFVSSIRTVKSFHLEEYVEDKGHVLEGQGQHAVVRAFFQNLLRWSISNAVAGLWLIAFAWIGFKMTLNGDMTPGIFASTFFLAARLWFELEVLASIQEKLYEYGNGVSRLVETLRIQPKSLDVEPLQPLPARWSSLSLDHLNFVYGDDPDQGQGVYDIDFTVKRGEKIAFVGESGAGKSTLIKLLMKQMLPDSGAIKVDDTDLRHITSREWLGQIGFVPQDVELFNMSIRENILIDQPDIDEAVYRRALEQSALSEFIDRLPEGDQTMIGERGIKLSGGQRQRLGIARALVRQSEIIIFDEATSSLDSLSEKKIHYAMEHSFEGHTVFLIAHRLSTVRHVDRVIVLEQGRIIEQGSFDELIAKPGGTFAQLWDIQTKAMEQEREAS